MTKTAIRLLVVASFVVVTHFGIIVVRSGAKPMTVPIPERKLESMPMILGEWTGENVKTDERVLDRLAVESVDTASRAYQDASFNTISLHMAVITGYTDASQGIPHHPLHCHKSQGYENLSGEREKKLTLPDGSTTTVALVTMRKDGRDVMLLYWYHLGNQTVLNQGQLRKAKWKLRGREEWPPLVKVLLTTSAADAKGAEKRLMDFAKLLRTWTDEFNGNRNLVQE